MRDNPEVNQFFASQTALDRVGLLIEALHAPAVMSGVVERIVGVTTLGDRLALTISSKPLMDVDRAESDRAATTFLSEGVKRLELAVGQEVASLSNR